MPKVFVLELADDADINAAVILLAHGRPVDGSHVHIAIREDAERVLRIFDTAHLEEAH